MFNRKGRKVFMSLAEVYINIWFQFYVLKCLSVHFVIRLRGVPLYFGGTKCKGKIPYY